ncbi:major facilitator transporter [Oenococcus oeni IOEB_C23]|uniref:MFS transporter n=1 Tax=Oenococcus oeni TaxID=1247 RepID=UPI0004A0007D|nr:MFS transporter [Oenococcus oeni]KDE87736.1 major facilitator transporter [Oenococcus oeni]KGH65809.1 major facilitator transporter [Oenococcus oeni IOEB_C23]
MISKSLRRKVMFILYTNYFVYGLGLLILTQNMFAFSKLWNTPLSTVSYTISAVGIGRISAYYILGSFSDRIGRKPVLYAGMLSYLLFFIMTPFIKDFHLAYLLIILAGVANSALDASTYPIFLEIDKKSTAPSILIKAVMSMGEFVLPISVVYVEKLQLWFGINFMIAAAILLINFILLLPIEFSDQSFSSKENFHLKLNQMSNRQFFLLCSLALYGYSSMAIMIHFTQWVSIFAGKELDMTKVSSHLLLSLYSLGSIVGVIAIFTVVKNALIKNTHLIVLLSFFACFSLILIAFNSSDILVHLSAFVFGFTAAGGVMQVALNLLISLFPGMKGRATAIFFTLGSLATFSVPLVTGILSRISIVLTMRSIVVTALLNLIISIFISFAAYTKKENSLKLETKYVEN